MNKKSNGKGFGKAAPLRLGIIYGGKSGEHDVSRCSAASVANVAAKKYDVICIGITRQGQWHVQHGIPVEEHPKFGQVLALHNTGQWHIDMSAADDTLRLYNDKSSTVVVDVVFPLVHGTYGEDGTLQGLLEMVGVPYVGPGVLGSAVGMDKDIAKQIAQKSGVAIVPFETVHAYDLKKPLKSHLLQRIAGMLPVFVKPANAGSSVGITKVVHKEDLEKALRKAFAYDTKVIVEKAITCREFEVAVLGNEKPQASVVGEVIPQHEYYSYQAKYMDKEGATLVIPANIPQELATQLQQAACNVYKVLGCQGMARVDFFLDKNDGTLYFNEVNTLPGFTSISMYPKLWEYSGVPYDKLIDRLVKLALQRHRLKKKIAKAFLLFKK